MYKRQVMNNVHVGNYGIEKEEVESESIKISGMICKKFNDGYSRKRASESLEDYFKNDGIVSISDVDTRAIAVSYTHLDVYKRQHVYTCKK